MARVEESMDSIWMFEGTMVIQGGQTNQMLPWLLSMIFSELFRAHGLPLGLLAALSQSDLGCGKVVQSGSSKGDMVGPSGP